MIVYILGTIFIPLILLAIILLNKNSSKKSNVKKSILIVVFALIIYIINIPTLLVSSTYITTYISNHLDQNYTKSKFRIFKIITNKRMATKGFLYKSDVEYIINIAERRSEKVIVNYKFDDETITISNKDGNFKDKITTNLKWEYYKFSYTYTNDIVTINIEKYANTQENEEKNSNIILAGNMRNDLIQNITMENIEPTSTNFVIENSFTLTPGYRPNISNLRFLSSI